jgi:hypothetical protein
MTVWLNAQNFPILASLSHGLSSFSNMHFLMPSLRYHHTMSGVDWYPGSSKATVESDSRGFNRFSTGGLGSANLDSIDRAAGSSLSSTRRVRCGGLAREDDGLEDFVGRSSLLSIGWVDRDGSLAAGANVGEDLVGGCVAGLRIVVGVGATADHPL